MIDDNRREIKRRIKGGKEGRTYRSDASFAEVKGGEDGDAE
jgi:hypothetical protein